MKPHGQFFSFWGYKNSYLCGCESHRRFLSFRNKKIIVWGDPPPPASRCFSQKAIAFLLFLLFYPLQKNWFTVIYIVWSHTGNFFLFEVIRIVTCAVRTTSRMLAPAGGQGFYISSRRHQELYKSSLFGYRWQRQDFPLIFCT